MTKRKDVYFGAATLTEWAQAFKTPDHFKFVIAKTDDLEEAFEFREYSPAEFMQHSTIPPFKIFFNVNLNGETKVKARTKAVPLNRETMDLMIEVYEKIKKN